MISQTKDDWLEPSIRLSGMVTGSSAPTRTRSVFERAFFRMSRKNSLQADPEWWLVSFPNLYRNNKDVRTNGRLYPGGGGAARSAVYALVKFLKCKTVYLINRDPAEVQAVIDWCTQQGYGEGLIHVTTATQAASLEGPGAIVACVPDFPPVTDAEKAARATTEAFLAKPHKGAMLEMCYHPSPWTELGNLAEQAGWKVILGTEAMIYQGLAQQTLWHGRPTEQLPVTAVKEMVARELSKSREH